VTRAPGGRESDSPEHLLQGSVVRITYQNPETRYCVLRLSAERGFGDPRSMWATERVTAVGTAPELAEGLRVRLGGEWTQHPQHGRQFEFEAVEILPPLDRDGLIRYLSSHAFHGVGPKLAERIVDALGASALEKIRADPGVLLAVRGLTPVVSEGLAAQVRGELAAQELMAFLLGLGLGPVLADTVLDRLGLDAEAQLRADPYLLARRVRGLGFGTADAVARRLGFELDAPERRRGALLITLEDATGEGHSLLEEAELVQRAAGLTGLAPDDPAWEQELDVLERQDQIVLDRETRPDTCLVYLPAFHTAERALARNLLALVRCGPVRPLADEAALAAAEARTGLSLHTHQREAVLGLLRSPVALLTGGPGVGKTTIARLVVALAEDSAARVLLASPTGRAAKRLAEATGRDASTVHRLLGWEPHTGSFQHDSRHPLEADLVVVDEISMLDVVLAHHLVKAIQPPTRLILVGDPDQLPSVSAGCVLADLLASHQIPTWRLTHIYRQGTESLIIENAHRILAGEALTLPGRSDPESDFYFFPAEEEQEAGDRLIEVVTKRIPERFGLDWTRDVQVLSPMYRGACGVDAINERLRDALASHGAELEWRGRTFRVGDRVIHTRNDYDKLVFNGDMGVISYVAGDGSGLTVRFPEREVGYARKELTDLSLAFAITVHRSQGGEFPAVVIPVVPQHFAMLERQLLYTAVTRAKKLVVLVGSRRALRRGIENARVSARESGLADRLRTPES